MSGTLCTLLAKRVALIHAKILPLWPWQHLLWTALWAAKRSDTRTMLSETEMQERTDPIVSSCEQRIQHRFFVSGRGCRQPKGASWSVVLSTPTATDILVQIKLGAALNLFLPQGR
jgi:hypothetical protein